MSERRPAPPEPRASLVDSGWSEPPSQERELPRYDDTAREHLVTRVDDQIQARIAAMNYDDRTEVTSAPKHSPPPPALSSPVPAAKPLARAATPLPDLSGAALDERTLVDALAVPVSSSPPTRPQTVSPAKPATLPPPKTAPSRPHAAPRAQTPPPPVAQTAHKHTPTQPPPPPSAVHKAQTLPPAAPPVAAAPLPPPAFPPPAATPSLPPPSLPPPLPLPRPSFVPLPSAAAPPTFPATPASPGLGEALRERVLVGGVGVPLWGVLLSFLFATAGVALMGGIVFAASQRPKIEAAAPAGATPSALTPLPAGSGASAPAATDGAPAGSLIERARSGDERALAIIERQRPEDRGVDEALALATGKVAQQVAAVTKLRARLASDPGLAQDPKVIADLRRFAQEPDTSRDALAAMAGLPGPLSADLLYEAWTATAERSTTTELAQALLMSRDVRPKASPALAVALELRAAESCEDNAKLLQRAIDVGDKRAFAPLTRLLRRNGCGANKQEDCFACLREGDQLKRALTAVKLRREPEFVRRDGH